MNIEKLQEILSSDFAWLYLASLISADVLDSKEKCIESLNKLNFIKDNIEKLELSEEIRNKIINYSIEGIDIVNRDLKEYE
jgi:hypothetical protein